MASRTLVSLAVTLTAVGIAGTAALGTAPAASATGDEVVAWLRANREGVRWSIFASTVSAPLFAAVIALLRRQIPAPHRDVYLIGGIGVLVAAAVQSWFLGGLVLHADRIEPATARTILDVAAFFGPVLTGAFMTLIAPVTLLALRRHSALPKWLGVLGAVAFAEQALETVTIFGSSGFTEPGGAMNLQLGAALVSIWLLAFALWAGIRGVESETVVEDRAA